MRDQAVVLIDRDGTIRFWSDGATTLLRREPGDVTGRRVDLIIPEYFRDQHWAAFRQAMSVGALRESRDQFVVPVQVAEDEVLPLVASLALVKDASGMAVGAIAVFSSQS